MTTPQPLTPEELATFKSIVENGLPAVPSSHDVARLLATIAVKDEKITETNALLEWANGLLTDVRAERDALKAEVADLRAQGEK